MIIAMNRQGVPTVGEASKTIARSLLSPSLFAQLILFGRLIFDHREKDFPPTAGLGAPLRACGNSKLSRRQDLERRTFFCGISEHFITLLVKMDSDTGSVKSYR